MADPMFYWLGSGRTRKRPVAEKARLLDGAARAGLPVPPGALLLDEFYRFALDKDLLRVDRGRVLVPDAELLYNTLFYSVRLPPFERPVAVRAAFAAAAPDPMPEGCYASRLGVATDDEAALTGALAAVWSSAATGPDVRRVDVLVMEMLAGETAGVAWLTADGHDIVQVGDEDRLALPHLGRWRLPADDLSPPLRRLQMLLRGVRRTFGSDVARLEFADDGRVCWLMQLASA